MLFSSAVLFYISSLCSPFDCFFERQLQFKEQVRAAEGLKNSDVSTHADFDDNDQENSQRSLYARQHC